MKTKDIRKALCTALDRVQRGELAVDDAKSIIGLANQISASMKAEVAVAHLKIRLGGQADKFGDLNAAD